MNNLQSCDNRAGQALKIQISEKARQLVYQEHGIFITWVPGHNEPKRNKSADKTLKEATKSEGVQKAK